MASACGRRYSSANAMKRAACAGVRPGSREQLALPHPVRREPDVLPLAMIATSCVLLLVSFFV